MIFPIAQLIRLAYFFKSNLTLVNSPMRDIRLDPI